MKYFFILGNNPSLSIAEISAFFGLNNTKKPQNNQIKSILLNEAVFILETNQEINAKELIKKLGGTIKIGLIKAETSQNALLEETKKLVNEKRSVNLSQNKENNNSLLTGKFNFGFSFYGKGKINLKKLGMETKKHLREKNISCRWVSSKNTISEERKSRQNLALSSVIVEQNNLIKSGIEISIIEKDNHVLIGQTLAVQAFKELSARDYGRPARDDQSGMLPPKLAQIMLNLGGTKERGVILDPFCGSGTILSEALLMGYEDLIGSDFSEKAINDTKKNIEWIQKKYKINKSNILLYTLSAVELSKKIKANSVSAIITEPYLGPQRGKINLKKTIQELETLYSRAIFEFEKILKPNGIIVMLFPVFYNKHFLNPKLGKFKIINPIPENLRKNKIIQTTKRQSIVYGRENQKVWREIIIMKKQSSAE